MKELERAKQLQSIEMQMEYDKRRALTEVNSSSSIIFSSKLRSFQDEKDRINDRYRQ